MAILTIHHWDRDQERGVRELRRVARGPVVILTIDPEVSSGMWLMADYPARGGRARQAHIPEPRPAQPMARAKYEDRDCELDEYDAGLRLVTSSTE